MTKRPTLTDVAREAQVGVATVDRVLNGRTPVRPETAERVYCAARKIGYHAAGLIGQRLNADAPQVRLGFVLNKEKQSFYRAFSEEIETAVRILDTVRGSAIIRFAPSQSPGDIKELMLQMRGKVDAIAVASVDHHTVTEVVQELKDDGIPTFALLNDFAAGVRHSYVGLNNLKAGRIAGWMTATAARPASKIAVFVGGHRWHGHALRETGLRSYFREHAPHFDILETLVNLETRQLTYEATLNLLARHPDLGGLYVSGGGMEGAIAALREVRSPGEVALIVNELTPESRSALSDRYVTMVMSTPLPRVCGALVRLMVAATRSGVSQIAAQHFLEPEIFTPESF